MNDRETLRFEDVRRSLSAADVFTAHDWTTQSRHRWKGSCPWHESDSGTCFSVNPDTLEWYCFSCQRGGGPLEYVAELEGIGGGARGSLQGEDFIRAWEALARHAGCEGPPDVGGNGNRTGGTQKSGNRAGRQPKERHPKGRPSDGRQPKERQRAGGKAMDESASTQTKGRPSPPHRGTSQRGAPPRRGSQRGGSQRGGSQAPDLDTPERELREALVRYREALKGSEKARTYVEGRGLSVETLHARGCGYAAPGEWIGSDNAPRLVTPHTTPSAGGARLVNLSGRYLGDCPDGKRHRHVAGNPTGLFNAPAVQEGSGPLVLCEGPLDALSFIEAGHARAAALHNTKGVPWTALRGNVSAIVFAFDADETGRAGAAERAREAVCRGYEAHILPDGEGAYGGHSDPNDALQHGALNLDYLREVGAAPAESREAPADRRDPDEGQPPTAQPNGEDGTGEGHTAADLVAYWNGDVIGHLGRWIWERERAPFGDAGAGLYADRELHKWIKEKLEAGPGGTTQRERGRLRWALWRLYATFGPEDVPAGQIPMPPPRRR